MSVPLKLVIEPDPIFRWFPQPISEAACARVVQIELTHSYRKVSSPSAFFVGRDRAGAQSRAKVVAFCSRRAGSQSCQQVSSRPPPLGNRRP